MNGYGCAASVGGGAVEAAGWGDGVADAVVCVRAIDLEQRQGRGRTRPHRGSAGSGAVGRGERLGEKDEDDGDGEEAAVRLLRRRRRAARARRRRCSGGERRPPPLDPDPIGGEGGDIFGGGGGKCRWVSGFRGPGGLREWVGWPAGPGGLAQLGHGPRGFLLSFFCLFSLLYFLFLFIFFSVLNHFKLSRHFIKMCLLHHIYLCKIWHLPNIFVLNFEKLLLSTLI